MKCVAMFFLLVGAFILEWSERGFSRAVHELKVYWKSDYCCSCDDDNEGV